MAGPVPTIACTKPEAPVAQALRDRGVEVSLLHIEAEMKPFPERYGIGEGRVAERITTAQFIRGIVWKTLFQTAIDMRGTVAAPMFVIEGEFNYEYSAIHPNAVRGALSALVMEYGATVLRSVDVADSAALIAMMAEHAQFGVPEISLAAKRKPESPADEQRRVIEMLPGVGFTLARRLLQHFGSIERIMRAGRKELAEVKGLSVKGTPKILDVFGREYCAVDFEADIEDVLALRPEMLFDMPVALVDRQHFFRNAEGDRLIADLVFADDDAKDVYVVEIKRGALQRDDERQLSAYLDAAGNSKKLANYMMEGYGLRGILAAPNSRIKHVENERIEIRLVDSDEVARELAKQRLERLGENA